MIALRRAVSGRGALLFSLFVLGLFVYAAYEMNTSFTTRGRLFGNAIIVPALALAVLQVLREARRTVPLAAPTEAVYTRSALAWGAAFLATLWAFGLTVAVPLFSVVYLRRAAGEPWLAAGVYALGAWLFVMLLFDRLLHVPLPGGAIPLPGITN